jgi:hypothetical protein
LRRITTIGFQSTGLTAAATARLVDELARIEYCYTPPVNDCIEPLVVDAEAVLRRL